jgi:phage FluMu protein Com
MYSLPDLEISKNITRRGLESQGPVEQNRCPDCKVMITKTGDIYCCPQCKQIIEFTVSTDYNSIMTSSVKFASGTKTSTFIINGDSSAMQYNTTLAHLKNNAENYKGLPFAEDILAAVANKYTIIQNYKSGDKKNVMRGNNKNEILAALLYYECINRNNNRSKSDIHVFMNLNKTGFSNGDKAVKELHGIGIIKFDILDERIEGFLPRYLDNLNISHEYDGFIIDVVERCTALNIGISSHLPSKIVGTIWLLIVKLKLNISAKNVEEAADNIRENTFKKFYTILVDNLDTFKDIFEKYKIPY